MESLIEGNEGDNECWKGGERGPDAKSGVSKDHRGREPRRRPGYIAKSADISSLHITSEHLHIHALSQLISENCWAMR